MHRRLGVGRRIGFLAQPGGGKGLEDEPLSMVQILLQSAENKTKRFMYMFVCLLDFIF